MLLVGGLCAEECPYVGGNLCDDLMIVEWVNRKVNDTFPVHYNQLFQGGYINMPSARVECEGRIGIGYSSIPPYRLYNLRCQLTSFLEVSGNYRVFKGIPKSLSTNAFLVVDSDRFENMRKGIFLFEAVREALCLNMEMFTDIAERAHIKELRVGIWWDQKPRIKYRRRKILFSGELDEFPH